MPEKKKVSAHIHFHVTFEPAIHSCSLKKHFFHIIAVLNLSFIFNSLVCFYFVILKDYHRNEFL